MGGDRDQGSSATGDKGQAAISLTPDVDRMHIPIFESSQLEGCYVRDLLCVSEGPGVWECDLGFLQILSEGNWGKMLSLRAARKLWLDVHPNDQSARFAWMEDTHVP